MSESPAPEMGAVDWRIDSGHGARAIPSVPDSSLRLTRAGPDVVWRSAGERPVFRLSAGGLRAGWYLFECRLVGVDGSKVRPCLFPGYDRGGDGDTQILLPDPYQDGLVRVLVLLKYDIDSLAFSPGPGPTRFQMGDVSLRKVSRLRALVSMLGAGATQEGVAPALARTWRFVRQVFAGGISNATVALFERYRQRRVPAGSDDYGSWVELYDTLSAEHLDLLRERATRLGDSAPLISILLPVYQTPETWLRRCIESVIAQAYPHWQLCIVDDASPDPRVLEILQEYASADSRIQFERRSCNGHISEASNSALAMARGDYVALLDHDDELRQHALLAVAEVLVACPDVGLVYSDEDKIDADGRRFDPNFKPDWDPDLLRSQNYVCHLAVLKTGLVRGVGGFRTGFEGSQDHDLVLRCSERLSDAQIRHIPRVLYHWRAIPGSTALTRDAKDYAAEAGVRAVAEHLQRLDSGARAEHLTDGHYRVRWPLPSPAPKVSIVIPTRDRVDLLRTCVESILSRTTYPAFEVVVVDNLSSDPAALAYLSELESHDRVRVLRYQHPFNYSAINNWAVSRCDGRVVALLNNDIEVISADWLEEMVSHALRSEIGAVGAMLYYPNDTIQHAGVILGIHGVAAHIHAGRPRGYPGHCGRARVVQRLSAVTGACLLVRRDLYERIGGMDESLEIAFNDIDFCLRLRNLGYANLWTPLAELYHHESASRGAEDTEDKKKRFAREVELMRDRWGRALESDPAFNPNLSLDSRYFDPATPPRHQD